MSNQYRVEDLAVLVLQNLSDLTIDQLNSVIEMLDYSRCAYFKPAFDFAKAFYDREEHMPDEDYMTLHFDTLLYQTSIHYHPQFVADFINYVTVESVSVKTQKALNQGKFEDAMSIIQTARKSNTAPILSMQDVLQLWLQNRKEFSFGLKLAIPELDGVYKFLGYKTLNVLAAPPANFKTTVACSVSLDAVLNQGLNVVYITLEDTSEIIYQNHLAGFAKAMGVNIVAEEIKRYLLPEEKLKSFEDLASAWDKEVKGKLAVLSAREVESFTPAYISKALDGIYADWDNKLDVVIVDHFNIMNDPIPGLQLQGPALAKYYVRYMTNLAISFGHKGFILVGLAQINREGQTKLEKGKELTGTELADTSELHRSATTLTSIYADDQDRDTGMVRMRIVKNRLGPQGQLFMVPIFPSSFKVIA